MCGDVWGVGSVEVMWVLLEREGGVCWCQWCAICGGVGYLLGGRACCLLMSVLYDLST